MIHGFITLWYENYRKNMLDLAESDIAEFLKNNDSVPELPHV